MATETLEVTIRPAQPSDLEAGAPILFEAFKSIAEAHGFEPDLPSVEIAASMGKIFLNHPKIFGVAADVDGKLAGLNFLSRRNEIGGVGPVVVDPKLQARGIGRLMMKKVLDMGKDLRGIRLVQDAYNIRPMRDTDLKECNDLCTRVHGFDRAGELADAMTHFGAVVLIRRGRIVAYASAPSFWVMNHGVAETDKDMKALLLHIGMVKEQAVSLLIPSRNNDFFRWCLSAGLRIAKPMTLMTTGFYQEPKAPWYPSVEY